MQRWGLLWLFLARAAAAQEEPMVLVTDEASGSVVIIDPVADRVVARVPVGKHPRGVRLSSDGGTAYVALSGSPSAQTSAHAATAPADRAADGIGVLDLASRRIVRVLSSGPAGWCSPPTVRVRS